MEFIAIRENMRREEYIGTGLMGSKKAMNFGANLPEVVTPEFVRDEVGRRPRHHPLQHQPS